MAQGSKSDITESAENGALRQEIADALGASTDDPQVDHVIDSMAGSAVITEMREAAARALDAAPAAPTTPESGQPAAGPATVVPAAPEDNPYTGLTIGEILSRPWKWNTVEKSPDGLTTTVDHEYIPDPNGPIGTKIETTTKELAGVDAKMVQTTVNAPGQPATIYTQTYRDGELVSSSKQSSDNIFGNQVTDADGRPAVPDARAGIPGASRGEGMHDNNNGPDDSPPSTPKDGDTPPSDAPAGQVPTPDTLGGATQRTFVDGVFQYQEYDNGDGTFTWVRYDSRDHTSSSATTTGLVDGRDAAAGLDYSGRPATGGGDDRGDPSSAQDGADDPHAGESADPTGGGDDRGDPSSAQDGADDPDAGASGDEGGGGDEEGDPSSAQDGADDPDAGASGDEGGGDDDTGYYDPDYIGTDPLAVGGASSDGGTNRDYVEVKDLAGQHLGWAPRPNQQSEFLEDHPDLVMDVLRGDYGDPNDPNASEAPAPDPTSQPGYGNTDPVGDPDVAMLEGGGSGHLGFTPLGGDFGDPNDPNVQGAPSGDGIPDPSTASHTVDAAEHGGGQNPVVGSGTGGDTQGSVAMDQDAASAAPSVDTGATVDQQVDAPSVDMGNATIDTGAAVDAPSVDTGDGFDQPVDSPSMDAGSDFDGPSPGADAVADAGGTDYDDDLAEGGPVPDVG